MNRPPEVPDAYIFYKGDWCHPSRVPKDMRLAAQALNDDHSLTSHDAAAMCDIHKEAANMRVAKAHPPKLIRQSTKPLLNQTEQRCYDMLVNGCWKIFKQSFTLRLDPPYRSYTPDLAYIRDEFGALVFVEVKGPHRFRRAGIAKAALAAKTYPQFRFELFEWANGEWKESVLTP